MNTELTHTARKRLVEMMEKEAGVGNWEALEAVSDYAQTLQFMAREVDAQNKTLEAIQASHDNHAQMDAKNPRVPTWRKQRQRLLGEARFRNLAPGLRFVLKKDADEPHPRETYRKLDRDNLALVEGWDAKTVVMDDDVEVVIL